MSHVYTARLVGAGLLATLAATATQARADADEVDARLQLFRDDTPAAMALHPQKYDEDGRPVQQRESVFSEDDVESRDFVVKKYKSRDRLCRSPTGEMLCTDESAIQGNDLPGNLVDDPSHLVSKLEEMDKQGLRRGHAGDDPWSDTYWPYYEGVIGARYADAYFPASLDWKDNFDYVQDRTAASIVQSGVPRAIDNLSPAEKYDLLVGDGRYTLTRAMWSFGKPYYDDSGKVEAWMGICDGWASAAIQLKRPGHKIEMTSADGHTKIGFYPSDVKALSSTLWATGYKNLRFIAGRCRDKDPKKDDNGRILSQDCFDTNPGTWHQGIVNQVGLSKRSFIMDAQYDYEVWNQPIVSYQYSYFNPQSYTQASTLAKATVKKADFTNDKFKKYRSPNGTQIVGISMKVTYVQETVPSHATVNTPANDVHRTVTYLYDLELDANGKIIGGEWYQNEHPDFLWVAPKSSQASSVADGQAPGSWGAGNTIPASWTNAAVRASNQGQPLGKVVQELVKRAAGS